MTVHPALEPVCKSLQKLEMRLKDELPEHAIGFGMPTLEQCPHGVRVSVTMTAGIKFEKNARLVERALREEFEAGTDFHTEAITRAIFEPPTCRKFAHSAIWTIQLRKKRAIADLAELFHKRRP